MRTRLMVVLAGLALVLAAVQTGLAAPSPQAAAGNGSVTGQIQSYWVTGFNFGKYSLPGNFPYFNYSLTPNRTNKVRVFVLGTNTSTEVTGQTNSYTPFRLTGLGQGVWDIVAVSSDANGRFPGKIVTNYDQVFNVRETVYLDSANAGVDVGLLVVPLLPAAPGPYAPGPFNS